MATNLTSVVGLPPGWKREESLKQSGLSSGKTEVYYVSPGGRKLRNRVELQRALGDRYDLSNFDWRTGRQTASMLRQSVELVRGHPDSRRNDLQHGPKDRPRQLFYHKRFDNLRACDPDTGEPSPEIGLPKHLQPAGGGPVTGTDQLVLSVADCLSSVGGGHSGAVAVVGQQNCKAFEKNPHVSVNPDQPLVRYHLVSDDEVRQQEAVVREARRRLALALRLFKAGREASAA
uniref:MBD domain-containing protein n=1 Tax=Macrostomum lignano TaxID=282301 RepID=A0A1I8HGX1_9PLAT